MASLNLTNRVTDHNVHPFAQVWSGTRVSAWSKAVDDVCRVERGLDASWFTEIVLAWLSWLASGWFPAHEV